MPPAIHHRDRGRRGGALRRLGAAAVGRGRHPPARLARARGLRPAALLGRVGRAGGRALTRLWQGRVQARRGLCPRRDRTPPRAHARAVNTCRAASGTCRRRGRRRRPPRPVGQPAVGGDHAHERRAAARARSRRTISSSAASRRGLGAWATSITVERIGGRGLALEDDHDVLALGRGPALEQVDEVQHRRIAIAPPAVRPGADHVHPVDVPAHRRLTVAAVSLVGGAAAVALAIRPRGAWLPAGGATDACARARRRDAAAGRRQRRGEPARAAARSASSRLRVWLRSSWATAVTTGPRRSMIRCFCVVASAPSEPATSKTASIRDAVTLACWPPGPEERDARSVDLAQRDRGAAAHGHRIVHGVTR